MTGLNNTIKGGYLVQPVWAYTGMEFAQKKSGVINNTPFVVENFSNSKKKWKTDFKKTQRKKQKNIRTKRSDYQLTMDTQ